MSGEQKVKFAEAAYLFTSFEQLFLLAEPFVDDVAVIRIRHLFLEAKFAIDSPPVAREMSVGLDERVGTDHRVAALLQKIADVAYHAVYAIFVCFYVLAGDVRDKLLKTVRLAIHYELRLLAMMLELAQVATAHIDAEFERHIKSRQPRLSVEAGSRDVVNAVSTLIDQLYDLVNSNTAVLDLF